jgi:regulator of replication initiation timing
LRSQLDRANTELSELRTTLGQVTAYNEMLVHENGELREAANSGKGRRRHRDDESEGRQIKRGRRVVAHSSESESEGNEVEEETARVRLNFPLNQFYQ